jgi:hypothetical protein
MISNGSLDIAFEDEEQQQQSPEKNRTASSNRISLNKFKDQLAQRARTVITRSPSLSSLLTNTSTPPVPPEQVYWTEVLIERGKDLAVKDLNGSSDPYIKVLYGADEKYVTSIIPKNLNPVWNEKFTFFTHDLHIPLHFNIFDRDRIGRDESMGTTKIDLWKLPFNRLYSATLELENEKRNDGKNGTLKVCITLTPKTAEFRDEVGRKFLMKFF